MNIYTYLLGITIVLVDRVTKYYALLYLSEQSYTVNSFVSYELVVNRGISWGLFHTSHMASFVMITCGIVLVTGMVCMHAFYFCKKNISIIGHVCVVAGSLSNLVDRIWYGGVIDFIVLSYHAYSWPVFNCADIAIVIGVGLILLYDDSWK